MGLVTNIIARKHDELEWETSCDGRLHFYGFRPVVVKRWEGRKGGRRRPVRAWVARYPSVRRGTLERHAYRADSLGKSTQQSSNDQRA
jgi:hypothetical protein